MEVLTSVRITDNINAQRVLYNVLTCAYKVISSTDRICHLVYFYKQDAVGPSVPVVSGLVSPVAKTEAETTES